MVGDNYHDIEAGKNAGTASVGVAWSVKGREYIESFKPDYIIDEMADLLKILGVDCLMRRTTRYPPPVTGANSLWHCIYKTVPFLKVVKKQHFIIIQLARYTPFYL